jgi:hypothetical protein
MLGSSAFAFTVPTTLTGAPVASYWWWFAGRAEGAGAGD